MSKVVVMDHPLIAHKIGIIRKKETGTREFRDMVSEIGALITYEATNDLKLQDVEIETPICKTTQKMLKGGIPMTILNMIIVIVFGYVCMKFIPGWGQLSYMFN